MRQSSTYFTELYITCQRIVNHEHTLRKLPLKKLNHKVANVAKSLNEFPILAV